MSRLTAALPILVLAIWLARSTIATYGGWYYHRALHRRTSPSAEARICVIIPVRGVSVHLPSLCEALSAQHYPRWRVVFAVESAADPAYAALAELLAATNGLAAEIVVAGPATDTGQKVHNQLAALSRLRADDEVVVFADADIVPPADWLTRLAHPLRDPDTAVVAGYRWLMPEDDRLATAFVCLANASIAALPRLRCWNLAWGGSMALRRSTFDALDMRRWWRGSLNDDLQLTRAVRSRGGSVFGPTALLLPSPASFTWREAIAFGRRQYFQIRVYAPRHWLLAAAATTWPILGWAVAVPAALGGDRLAIGALFLACGLHQWRAGLRVRVARSVCGERRGAARLLLFDRWAAPAWLLFHAAIIWSTLFLRTINWGGRTYRVDGPQRLRIIAEPAARPPTP